MKNFAFIQGRIPSVRDRLRPLLGNLGFLQNVAILTVGTVAGQLVTIGASPLLTRFYDPEAFGRFGVFSAIVVTLSAGVTLKLEQAIVVERERSASLNVLGLCVLVAALVSACTAAVLLAGMGWIERLSGPGTASLMIVCVPASLLTAGLYNGLNFWSIRNKQFKALASYQLLRSSSVILLQIALALLAGGVLGLVVGQLIGQIIGVVLLFWVSRRDVAEALARLGRPRSLLPHLGDHKDFVVYGTPQSVLNAVSGNIPTILLATFFGAATSGLFWLAYRLLMLPSLILTESLRSVLYQRLAEHHHAGRDLRMTLQQSSLRLFAVCLPIAAILVVFGPMLFGFFFGPGWREAGEYARYLAPAWLIQNAVVPFAVAVPILHLQRQMLVLEVASSLLRAAAIFAGFLLGSPSASLICFSLVGIVASVALVGIVRSARGAPAVLGTEFT
jgi:lipopolysaccharide exporter